MDVLHISSSLLQGVEISPVIVENPVEGLMTLVQSLLGHFTPLTSTHSFLMQLQYQHATKSIKKNLAFLPWSLLDLSFSSFTADLLLLQMSCSRTYSRK